VSVVPRSTCVADGGVLEYAACCDTSTLDRADPMTEIDPLPPWMTTAVTRELIVYVFAGAVCVAAPSFPMESHPAAATTSDAHAARRTTHANAGLEGISRV
jgi:hypothetical protein